MKPGHGLKKEVGRACARPQLCTGGKEEQLIIPNCRITIRCIRSFVSPQMNYETGAAAVWGVRWEDFSKMSSEEKLWWKVRHMPLSSLCCVMCFCACKGNTVDLVAASHSPMGCTVTMSLCVRTPCYITAHLCYWFYALLLVWLLNFPLGSAPYVLRFVTHKSHLDWLVASS